MSNTMYLNDAVKTKNLNDNNLGTYDPYNSGNYFPAVPGPNYDWERPRPGDEDYEKFINETAEWRIDNAEGFLAKAKARLEAMGVNTAGLSKWGIILLVAAGSYMAWKQFSENG